MNTHVSPLPSTPQQIIHDKAAKILDLVPGLIAVYNIHTGEYIYINDSLTKILGYSKEEWMTKGVSFVATLIHPDDVVQLLKDNKVALKKANSTTYKYIKNEPIVAFEYRLKHKNGSWRWLKTDGVIFERDSKGKVAYVLNISLDITERKNAELNEATKREKADTKINENKERFKALLEHSMDAITLIDKNGKRQYSTPSRKNIIGVDEYNDIGEDVFTRIHSDDVKAVQKAFYAIGKTPNASKTLTFRIQHKNGKWIWIEATGSNFLHIPYVEAIVVNYRDVSDRVMHERQKDEFMGIVSHELKTPVTSLKAFGQVLHYRFVKAGDEESALLLKKMDVQITRLTALIGDLLNVTKIEGGKLQFENEYFNFDEMVEDVTEQIQRTTETHRLICEGASRKKMYGDRDRIGQVIINMLTNAIKYSPHADKVIITTTTTKDTITLCVQDFGIGIAREKIPRVFERFYRESGPKESTFPGLGLGMYISNEIIKRQGGKMTVTSDKNKGSTFCVSLPIDISTRNKKNVK